jgi:hypothetical protein
MPARKTRRGPSSSASRPAAGWAIALVRYRQEIKIAVWPTGTCTAAAIETSAVAITELLIGFSAAPSSIGDTKRGPNARSAGGRSLARLSAAAVLVPASLSGRDTTSSHRPSGRPETLGRLSAQAA